jgi:hypothetical protein
MGSGVKAFKRHTDEMEGSILLIDLEYGSLHGVT